MPSRPSKTTIYATVTAATLVSLLAGGAAALVDSKAEPMIDHLFEKFDANKDGKITRKEAQQHKTKKFRSLDADKDGSLSLDEFASEEAIRKKMLKRMKKHQAKKFERLDKDEDGKLSTEEFEKHARGHGEFRFDGPGEMHRGENKTFRMPDMGQIQRRIERHMKKMDRCLDDDDDHMREDQDET